MVCGTRSIKWNGSMRKKNSFSRLPPHWFRLGCPDKLFKRPGRPAGRFTPDRSFYFSSGPVNKRAAAGRLSLRFIWPPGEIELKLRSDIVLPSNKSMIAPRKREMPEFTKSARWEFRVAARLQLETFPRGPPAMNFAAWGWLFQMQVGALSCAELYSKFDLAWPVFRRARDCLSLRWSDIESSPDCHALAAARSLAISKGVTSSSRFHCWARENPFSQVLKLIRCATIYHRRNFESGSLELK